MIDFAAVIRHFGPDAVAMQLDGVGRLWIAPAPGMTERMLATGAPVRPLSIPASSSCLRCSKWTSIGSSVIKGRSR
jgi:hypothetical protein